MNGIINVYKERGFTSHDVVAKLRGILHTKKIGHTGTLDPEATGVLPVCVGKATKVCALLTEKDKTYKAEVKLGIITDTQDMTGEILHESPVLVTEKELQDVINGFVGEIMQIPPMYSAVKINGKKLYELARQGKEVERKPRKIFIHEIRLLSTALSEGKFTMEVSCSKGTYIRTLCHDIGEKLGCGAAMNSLIRTRVDCFRLEDARTLAEIEQEAERGKAEELMLPVDAMFSEAEECTVSSDALHLLANGNSIKPSHCSLKMPKQGEPVRMYDEHGDFYALYEYRQSDGMYHVVKMFHE